MKFIRIYLKAQATNEYEAASYYSGVCAIIGAWFGGALIPLDWDMLWQKWPVSVVYGSFIGYTIGFVLYLIVETIPASASFVDNSYRASLSSKSKQK